MDKSLAPALRKPRKESFPFDKIAISSYNMGMRNKIRKSNADNRREE
jgi:hypothetical protein